MKMRGRVAGETCPITGRALVSVGSHRARELLHRALGYRAVGYHAWERPGAEWAAIDSSEWPLLASIKGLRLVRRTPSVPLSRFWPDPRQAM